MRTPLVLFLLSLACVGGAYSATGQALTLPTVVSVLSAGAALILLLTAAIARLQGKGDPVPTCNAALGVPIRRPRRSRKSSPHVILDGSNVLHWNAGEPDLATLHDVIADLRARGYTPGIIFDANAGYKVTDRYLDDRHFAKLLNLRRDQVMVVHKGEPADPTILACARELKAKVITNDRYHDWADDFPEVANSGVLVQGGYRKGKLWLDEGALSADGTTARVA